MSPTESEVSSNLLVQWRCLTERWDSRLIVDWVQRLLHRAGLPAASPALVGQQVNADEGVRPILGECYQVPEGIEKSVISVIMTIFLEGLGWVLVQFCSMGVCEALCDIACKKVYTKTI